MKSLVSSLVCLLAAAASVQSANIGFVSFHSADNAPTAAASSAGFTEAPDAGYTQLLEANGHSVTRIVTSATPDTALLNSFDLVIISRSVPSGNYQNAGATAWNSVSAPTMVLGGYVLRNSRMGFTTGGTIPDTVGAVTLTATDPNHAIFSGITLDSANSLAYANEISFGGIVERGISVNTDPLAGGGVLLATVGTAGDAAFGGMLIGEWQAGATMGNGTADTLAGHRMVFLTGTREHSGLTSEGAGIYDLTPEGAQLFLNSVSYMAVPEPSVVGLGALAVLLGAVCRRRR